MDAGQAVKLVVRQIKDAPRANERCIRLGLTALCGLVGLSASLRWCVGPSATRLLLIPAACAPSALLVRNFFFTFLLMPSQLVARLQRDVHERRRADFLSARGKALTEELTVRNEAGDLLDAIAIHPDGQRRAEEDSKWVVCANPNGVALEEILLFAMHLAGTLECSVLVFNYRGVGRSEGRIHSGWDLVEDTRAVITLLTHRGVRPHNIILHGHSMGGAAVAHAAADMGLPVGVVNDRSFSNLPDVVKAALRRDKTLAVAASSFIGAVMGAVLAVTEVLSCTAPAASSIALAHLTLAVFLNGQSLGHKPVAVKALVAFQLSAGFTLALWWYRWLFPSQTQGAYSWAGLLLWSAVGLVERIVG
eukprot:Hpha_TRINITY_DN15551_c0_g2::TRINITY_DN15551_c0_g2_i1::g.106573::m.106573